MSALRSISLREMISRLTSLLDREPSVTFDRIKSECGCRQDVAVAFVALLTLLRRQAVVVTQPELFGAIVIERPLHLVQYTSPTAELSGSHGNT